MTVGGLSIALIELAAPLGTLDPSASQRSLRSNSRIESEGRDCAPDGRHLAATADLRPVEAATLTGFSDSEERFC